MTPRFLLDTHVVLRWRAEPGKLSRQQSRILEDAVQRGEPLAISAITLLEIAILVADGSVRIKTRIDDVFEELAANPAFRILPLTFEVAAEVAALGGSLRDPADRTIVATARVHRLRLVTSDQRIIDSQLASVVE